MPSKSDSSTKCEIAGIYNSEEAKDMIELASRDYQDKFQK